MKNDKIQKQEEYDITHDAICVALGMVIFIVLAITEGYAAKGVVSGFILLCATLYCYRQFISRNIVLVVGIGLCYLSLISF